MYEYQKTETYEAQKKETGLPSSIPKLTRHIKTEYICLDADPQSAIFKVIILSQSVKLTREFTSD